MIGFVCNLVSPGDHGLTTTMRRSIMYANLHRVDHLFKQSPVSFSSYSCWTCLDQRCMRGFGCILVFPGDHGLTTTMRRSIMYANLHRGDHLLKKPGVLFLVASQAGIQFFV